MRLTQLLKGSLEGCTLKVISGKTTYGYEILTLLRKCGFEGLGGGTLYPLLMRLEKNGLVRTDVTASPKGPNRKYFSLTEMGLRQLEAFEAGWRQMTRAVDQLFS